MDFQDQGTSIHCKFSRMHVYEIWHSKSGGETERTKKVYEMLVDGMEPKYVETLNLDILKSRVEYLCHRIFALWKNAHRNKTQFLAKNSDWLSIVEDVELESTKGSTSSHKRGRPRKGFSECSTRTKQRRLVELDNIDESLSQSFRESSYKSNTDFSTIDICTNEVLSLLTEAKLTKHQYLLVKEFINSKLSSKVLPSYNEILKAKKSCYPEKITVTESVAEINLQSLLDHTASRIVESQKHVIENMSESSLNNLCMIGKWGFDGSTGHNEYKQSFTDSETQDGNLFVTSYVPLRLVDPSDNKIIWKNPRPSSTRYCRPIRFQFKKENSALTSQEETYFKDKINFLVPSIINITNKVLSIKHELQLTMVDGKVCSALSQTSSSKWYICEAKPTEMNDVDKCLNKRVHKERYEFGLSPLHSWIRFFEYFIHVSYRLDIKKWQIRTKEEKEQFAIKKKDIQSQFRAKLSLIVDQPRTGGSGTSNDGNTARKFFENSEVSAEITGIDKCLIDRCATILKAMASGYKINKDKFRDFSIETARKLVKQYPWYYLPASVHKILIHGSEVIDFAVLPIGELSEEAAEAKNKDIKIFRLNHTRKISRIATNTDLLNRLLLSSDPLITGLRKLPRKKKTTLTKAVLDLLS